jgi:protease-4
MSFLWPKLPRVAVVEMWGPIGGGARNAEFGRAIRSLTEDDSVKAVVLDIDSPGGSATASDYLHKALVRLAKKKPLIAFVRGTAASGGYLLVCAATRIVAIPSAIVGSIGVIAIRPVLQDLLHRLGIQVFVRKTGPFKDMWAFYREPTDEEQGKIQKLLDAFHEQFVGTVAEARGLDIAKVKTYATGEVYTAHEALEMGLLDELGDLESAIDKALELGNVPRRIQYTRPRRPLLDRLALGVGGALAKAARLEVERQLTPQIYYRYSGRK